MRSRSRLEPRQHNNNMSIADIIGSKSVGLQCQYSDVTEYYVKDALPTSPTTKQHMMVIELSSRTWHALSRLTDNLGKS